MRSHLWRETSGVTHRLNIFNLYNPFQNSVIANGSERNLKMNAKEIVEKFVEKLWNQRQLELADEIFPADFVAEPIAH
jgi:steroid delta-isomerase-like uncharacterized protein